MRHHSTRETLGVESDWARIRASRVVYEDDGVLVLDKPAGIAVAGERNDADLAGLAKDAGEWLMPAHRIDKVTSGLVLLAKSAAVHGPLTQQFRDRSVDKRYLAITNGGGLPERGTIDLPLCVGRKNRVRVAASRQAIVHDVMARRWSVPTDQVREQHLSATTAFDRLWQGDLQSLLVAKPTTGRRHQVRVHLAWIGHGIVGDPLFGGGAARTHLHAWRLGFDATHGDGRRISLVCGPSDDFWAPLVTDAPELQRLVAGYPGDG